MSNPIPRRRVLQGSALLGATSFAGCLPETVAAADRSRGATGDSSGYIPAPTPVSNISQADALDLDGLESFVDDQLDDLLDAHDVVGASVAVVHDGTVELTAGYGERDAETGESVDPAETAFRIGSVSKPLVWTAVAQLLEDGRIDPDEPLEASLESVSIPETDDDSITMAHLATHTAGFEERFQGTWVDDPDEIRPLPDVLSQEQPNRVRPPGEIISYSNYGTALAAQVVADVTGMPFEDYAREHLFDPLEMDHTTFEQPVPDGIEVTKGYTAAAGMRQETPPLHLEIAPAGAATATAADMAQFLRVHLGDGDVDGNRVLESETVEALHQQWFTHHDALPGMAFGLIEGDHSGIRVLEHDGAIPGTSYSYLLVVPEYDFGLFCAYNTDTGAAANSAFVDALLEEYLPTDDENDAPAEPDGPPEHAAALEGTYRGVRIAESTHARFSSTLQAGSVDVTVDDDGYLVTDFGGGPERWVETDESLVFTTVDGDDTLAFGAQDGDVTHLFLGFQAFERISRHESLSVHGGLAGAATLGMLSGAVGWPLARARRRFGGGGENDAAAGESDHEDEHKTDAASSDMDLNGDTHSNDNTDSSTQGVYDRLTAWLSPARARWIAGGAITALFGFVVGAFTLLVLSPYTLLSRPPLAYDLVSLLPILGVLGTAAAAVCTVVAWREGYWGRLSRIHYALVTVSLVGFCWLLSYWNFLRVPL
ncbi:beta-lactamase family protein [Natronolimnobius sp. AArcel1]|uniref:serine hydrolase domain-containing protein n=1 Tax=Natronolimnobius sp. AArcel1 TaxID=1679093 RepID=UPI0013EB7CA3|nr:serine hydrolase domain-containing protein [Natronolimnobius sp. AArcel1]NGM69629.1 beta-lactamase family protein [Natronolimnobius sp. AArcel1]